MQTLTFVPASCRAQCDTQTGLTQTDANPCSAASAQSCVTSRSVASGLSSVWSMSAATSGAVFPMPGAAVNRPAPAERKSPILNAHRCAQVPVQSLQTSSRFARTGRLSRS